MTVRRKLPNWDRAAKRTLVSLLYQAHLRCMLQKRQAAYRRDQSVYDLLVGFGNFVIKNKKQNSQARLGSDQISSALMLGEFKAAHFISLVYILL